MKPLCVIPARRNSKRLAVKNIKLMLGKPMLVYSIEAALRSGLFNDVIVSTEDDEIARIAEASGAKSHRRPQELAGDLVSATDVCLEVADTQARLGKIFDAVYCLQPSSPLRTSEDIHQAWIRFVNSGANYLVSVTPVDPHYFHWVLHQEKDADWKMYFGEKYLMERPLLPPVYRPNGAIKIAKTDLLARTRNFFGAGLEVFEMPDERSVHVAEQYDFDLAEYLLSKQGSAGRCSDCSN